MKLDKKNIYLIAAIIVLILLSWNLTIKKTLDYKEQYDQLSPEVLVQKQKRLEQLKTKRILLNKGLSERNIDIKTTQAVLFNIIEENVNTVQIVNYNNQMGYETTNEQITYHQIELKGDYKELILTIDLLLKKMRSLQLQQLDFKTKKNFRTRKTSLSVRVILEERGVKNS